MNLITDYDKLDLSKFDKIKAVDLETTGLYPQSCRVIEYGSYTVSKSGVLSELDFLINPECKVPEKITEITGLTDDDVKNEPTFMHLSNTILKDLTEPNCLVIAHNAKFDFGFLKEEFKRAGINLDSLNITYMCTRDYSRHMVSLKKFDNKGSNSLEHLMGVFGIEDPNHHRSINDCMMCYNLLLKLYELK